MKRKNNRNRAGFIRAGKAYAQQNTKAVPGNSGTSCFILFFKMFSGESFDS